MARSAPRRGGADRLLQEPAESISITGAFFGPTTAPNIVQCDAA